MLAYAQVSRTLARQFPLFLAKPGLEKWRLACCASEESALEFEKSCAAVRLGMRQNSDDIGVEL